VENKPLSGIKVIELATVVAAPSCGRMLAAFGAQVIKVEPPRGDPWRQIYPVTGKGFDELEDPIYDLYNTGKEAVVVNLKNPDGYELVMRMLEDADVLLTNTRPRSMRKLGLDHVSIRERFPRIIYAALTSYGDKGPDADKPGFDSTAFWARSGFPLDMTIMTDDCYPVNTPTGVGDMTAGLALCSNILAALINREKTGKGDYVNASLYGSAIWVMSTMLLRSQKRYGSGFPIRREQCYPTGAPFKCSDGKWVLMAILEFDRYAPPYFEALGLPDVLSDPRFSVKEEYERNSAILLRMVEEAFLKKTSAEWLKIFAERDIACEPVNGFCDVIENEQAWINGYLEYYNMLCGEKCVVSRLPVTLESYDVPPCTPPPLYGETTAKVLSEMGYSDREIESLAAKGAVYIRQTPSAT